ncbi:UDP-glycosyltransferase [Variovorax terrae]|uniref:UDP-glycosyltransferase n=1 Tax=Variovorax terrae TaxID=2923278 RepID=A0A9X1VUZ0_9BURK|nr:UDP-glycosyltransferase [Variovorax terrae]MCJ0764281.1 UDP-glycosyltransferase [Variovorax terrae]
MKTQAQAGAAGGGVLFVTYGNGHIAKVAPVVRALEARGVPCVVMALTLGYRQAVRLGFTPVGYQDFTALVDLPRVMAYGRTLLDGNCHPDVDEDESVCYLGINYAEWVDSFGEAGAAEKYALMGRRGFLPLNFIGKVIDHLKPALVVSTSSPRSEQAAIEAAVARGIPALTMMDLFALPHDNFLRQSVYADRITVLSEFVKHNLAAAGVDAARIEVTGCPAYDAMFDTANAEAGRKLREALGWEHCRVLMWAGNLEEDAPNVDDCYRGTGLGMLVEGRLRQWVESHPDAALLIRYHPNQYHLFPLPAPHPRIYFSNPATDRLQPQLHAADMVLVQTSTVGFEAALIGKRLLTLSFSPMVINFDFDYGVLGLGEGIASLDELVSVIDRPPGRRVDRSAFPPPGAATPRVVSVIENLLKRAPRTGQT